MMNWFINQTVYMYLVFVNSLIKCEWEFCMVFTIVSRRQATINTIKNSEVEIYISLVWDL